MTANNGWPGKPGVPMHPEKDGDHWLKSALTGEMYLFKWKAEKFYSCGQPQILPHWVNHPMWQVQEMIYLGPALTPDEAAALQKRCEEAERTAIQAAECHARETRRADALQKRVAGLEGALRFYEDPFKYTDIHGDDVRVPHFYSETNFGETARVALTGGKDE